MTGQVENQLGEVEVIASGDPPVLDRFVADLIERAPPLSAPSLVEVADIDLPAATDFEIVDSKADAEAQIFVPPDYFMCDDCRRELTDPADRRYGLSLIHI